MRELTTSGQVLMLFCHFFKARKYEPMVILITILLHFVWKTNVQDNPHAFIDNPLQVNTSISLNRGALRWRFINIACIPSFRYAGPHWKRLEYILFKKQRDKGIDHSLIISHAFHRKKKSLPSYFRSSHVPYQATRGFFSIYPY